MSDSFQQRTAVGAVVPFAGFAALALWGRRTSRTWLSLTSLAWLFGGLALIRLLS